MRIISWPYRLFKAILKWLADHYGDRVYSVGKDGKETRIRRKEESE